MRETVRIRNQVQLDEMKAREAQGKKRGRSSQRSSEQRAPVQITQDELLAEAALTAILNEESLTQLLAKEERKRKALAARKAASPQPTIRYHSSREGEYIHLLNCDQVPAGWKQRPIAPGRQAELCAITGLRAQYKYVKASFAHIGQLGGSGGFSSTSRSLLTPAFFIKSRDPQTDLPFATCEAFRRIREGSSMNEP